jgi:hypothetical protein
MVASLKKGFGASALAVVLLASMLFGGIMHVNAAMPQHHSNASTSHLALGGPNFVCPPPPFVCV